MVSILDLQHRTDPPKQEEPVAEQPIILNDKIEFDEAVGQAAPPEFEFVLGRRQIASLLFVAIIVLVLCIAVSYLAGRSMTPKSSPVAAIPAARESEPPPIVMNQEALPAVEPALFAEPKLGAVYIQMAAVEKGVSIIFAEGLRKRGLPAFVATGPSDKIFRVLIGPLPDPASYVKAKDTVDKIGLATFARKFPN